MRIAVTGLIVLHLLATIWHARAHAALGVALSSAETAFVVVVIVLAPIAGGVLLWVRRPRAGAWSFTLSMLGSFLFGAYHHYVAVSSDHVSHLPQGSPEAESAFVASAAALAVVELGSAAYGAWCVRRLHAAAGTFVGR